VIHRRYLAAVLFFCFAWFASILGFGLVIDPYGVSPIGMAWSYINKFKPRRLDIDRLIKPYEVWRYQPRTVFLGSSRIQQSLDPAVFDGTVYAPAYNASVPASTLDLNLSYLREYLRLDPRLHTVMVELFVYQFQAPQRPRAPDSWIKFLGNTASLFLSTDALWASVVTLDYNLFTNVPRQEIKPGGYFYYPPGMDVLGTFAAYPHGRWKPGMAIESLQLQESAFDVINQFVALCRQENLELIFVLTPTYAYDDYYLESIGAWEPIKKWLRRISATATVYSFSQPNAWVYEPAGHHMTYWNDPIHFSLEMGRAIELEMMGKTPSGVPDNFMMRLTPANVAKYVENRRQGIRQWASENGDFVAKFGEARHEYETAQ